MTTEVAITHLCTRMLTLSSTGGGPWEGYTKFRGLAQIISFDLLLTYMSGTDISTEGFVCDDLNDVSDAEEVVEADFKFHVLAGLRENRRNVRGTVRGYSVEDGP